MRRHISPSRRAPFPHAWYSQDVLSYRASKTRVSSLIISTKLFGSINQRAHSCVGLGPLGCWAARFAFQNGLGLLVMWNPKSNPSREIRKPIHKTNRDFSEASFRSVAPLAGISIKVKDRKFGAQVCQKPNLIKMR